VRSRTLQGQRASLQTPTLATGVLQRKCACGTHRGGGECAACSDERQRLQRSATRDAERMEVPAIVHEVLRSPGQPLDPATRAFFEPRFGHDFSHVRVHTDTRAAESAQAVNALAYTVGQDIVFASSRYLPTISTGRELLAHELTHALQQNSPQCAPGKALRDGSEDAAEREAETVAVEATQSPSRCTVSRGLDSAAVGTLQRQVTRAFSEEQFAPAREAFVGNAKKATRDSCIAIVNKGLRRLFQTQLRDGRLGSEMEKTMGRLTELHLADKALEIEFLDKKGRITKGTIEPDALSRSAEAEAMSVVGPGPGWYLFGLSIMDGYHSVLLAVDYRAPTDAKVYWMDQIYSGFDDVTGALDERITTLTKQWRKDVMGTKGKGYNTVTRIWPVIERLLGDFPAPQGAPVV
jgi:hypothetical protein